MIALIWDEQHLDMQQVLKRIRQAADSKMPLSLVRLGDGEHIVLAQDSVWPIERVLQEEWAILANQGEKGVTLPNLQLRDQIVEAIRKADIVGVLSSHDTLIDAPSYLKRALLDQILDYYGIQPVSVCDAVINRYFPHEGEFWEILRGRKIALISRWVHEWKELLVQKPYELNITLTIPFSHYEQIEPTLDKIVAEREAFDIALISCGVNAVILAQRIAESTGKIGIDFGKSAEFLVHGKVRFEK